VKIKLILPAPSPYWGNVLRPIRRKTLVPPLSLLTVAGLTPNDIEVSLTDENVEIMDYDEEVDLVGISAFTLLAPRAYEIADAFRERGVTVVMGGIHASALPHEAIQHVDAVLIGEAEGIWPRLLSDHRAGTLRQFYRNDELPNLQNLPLPRRDLIKRHAYVLPDTLQTTRGCPFRCKFCSVTHFFGHTYRFRPVADIVAEVETLHGRHIFFVDDNIGANHARAKELFKALTPLGIKWASQCSITAADDDELLEWAARSGCVTLIIGFESVSSASLQEVGKSINKVEHYKAAIRKLHDHGIAVYGTFVHGFDHDDDSVFEKTLEFTEDAGLDFGSFMILTPYPSTPLYQELRNVNRITSENWGEYYVSNVVFEPKLMSAEALRAGNMQALRELYALGSIFKRLRGFSGQLPLRIALNLLTRRRVREIAASAR